MQFQQEVVHISHMHRTNDNMYGLGHDNCSCLPFRTCTTLLKHTGEVTRSWVMVSHLMMSAEQLDER